MKSKISLLDLKRIQIVSYLLAKFAAAGHNKASKLKLIKMVWLADRLHLRRFGLLLTADKYYALKYGPIASRTLDIIDGNATVIEDNVLVHALQYFRKDDARTLFLICQPNDYGCLSEADQESLDQAFEKIMPFKPEEISEISHIFPEWSKFSDNFNENSSGRYLIDLRDFFENPSQNILALAEDDKLVALNKEIFAELPSC
jgi:uncharacterized phage-associated protein